MIVVFHHCGLSIISNMEFLYSWVTNLYICIAQLENTPIKSAVIFFFQQAVIVLGATPIWSVERSQVTQINDKTYNCKCRKSKFS